MKYTHKLLTGLALLGFSGLLSGFLVEKLDLYIENATKYTIALSPKNKLAPGETWIWRNISPGIDRIKISTRNPNVGGVIKVNTYGKGKFSQKRLQNLDAQLKQMWKGKKGQKRIKLIITEK